jgi:hypothetical protein
MLRRLLPFSSLLLLWTTSNLLAQVTFVGGATIVSGAVHDSLTGQPPNRTYACVFWMLGPHPGRPAEGRTRCALIDTLGRFILDSVAISEPRLVVTCHARTGPDRVLRDTTLALIEGVPMRLDLGVDAGECDHRRLRQVTRAFAGHYASGFEMSELTLCPGDRRDLEADSLLPDATGPFTVWVTWTAVAHLGATPVMWPHVEPEEDGSHRFVARLRGALHGPGDYGHEGVSRYELVVESVLTLQAPGKADCQ